MSTQLVHRTFLLKRTRRVDGVWLGVMGHNDKTHDLPTYYAVEWVRPAGWNEPGLPLRSGEESDPKKHELECRDKCGEVEQSL